MNIATRQLRAFVALAELRSFTRAAERSHLSQPAFSALIRSLEDAVGAKLFDRNTRNVELTVEGRLFLESAQRLVHDTDEALADVRDHAARRRGRVGMALLPSLAAGWLPPVLAAFRDAYPGIELEVADVLSEACLDRVRGGSADFALAATRADTAELRTDVFCTDRFHLVCRRDHALARQATLRLKDLASEPFVQMSRRSSVRQYLDAAVHPLRMNGVLEVEQLATVMGMVRHGLGISVVPELTLFHFRSDDIVTRPLQGPGLTRQIFLVRRRDRPLSTPAQALYEWVMQNRPNQPASSRRRRKPG
ncbi:LysR family transcriptional regulator [Piscinibacter sp. XHJ-5]|uniref:LysR family transcriptional regulator n=1 Tax=Piscinibacter sp. XHJ-5 TaxID=3037797 RepID=UPI002452E29D|nr:LysR family transcriptional regulator [Piscinibacter sp. XHJ-5]